MSTKTRGIAGAICSPNSSFDGTTCYSLESLKTIARAYNRDHPPSQRIKLTNNKQELWSKLNEKIQGCKTEDCWLKTIYAYRPTNTEIEDATFKPKFSKSGDLNTSTLNRVMLQYEETYPTFQYFKTLPSDAYKDAVAKRFGLNKKLRKETKFVGIIFNTEPSGSSGDHWVATFVSLSSKTIEFFDSLGHPPQPDIIKFFEKHFPNHQLKVNKTVHQTNGNECGIYALEFIKRRLEGKSFGSVTSKRMKIDRGEFLRS